MTGSEGEATSRLPFKMTAWEQSRLQELSRILLCLYGERGGEFFTRDTLAKRSEPLKDLMAYYQMDIRTFPILPDNEQAAMDDSPFLYGEHYISMRGLQRDLLRDLTKDYDEYLRQAGQRYFITKRSIYPDRELLRKAYCIRVIKYWVDHHAAERELCFGPPRSVLERSCLRL